MSESKRVKRSTTFVQFERKKKVEEPRPTNSARDGNGKREGDNFIDHFHTLLFQLLFTIDGQGV